MHNFDIPYFIVVMTGLAACMFLRQKNGTRVQKFTAPASLGLMVAYLFFSSPRWQLYPLHAAVLLLNLVWLNRLFLDTIPDIGLPKILRNTVFAVSITAVVSSAALCYLFPLIVFPAPTGHFKIGTAEYSFTDSSRNEHFDKSGTTKREIMVKIWYPADPPPHAKSEYLATPQSARRFGKILAEGLGALPMTVGMPKFLCNHLALTKTHSYLNAPVVRSAGPCPVLLFSHGIGLGTATQNNCQMEDLASHGYIVASIAHPYECAMATMNNGRIVTLDVPNLRQHFMETMDIGAPNDQIKTTQSQIVKDSLFRLILSKTPSWEKSLRTWTADMRFGLDMLERMNMPAANSVVSGAMDLSRVGIFGHSFGGVTACQVSLDDPRVKAGINYDCLQFGKAIDDTLHKPFMFMYAGDNPYVNDPIARRSAAEISTVLIRGAKHFNLGDIGLWGPFYRLIGFNGSIDGTRCLGIVSGYTRAFFDKHLKGEEPVLLKGEKPLRIEVE